MANANAKEVSNSNDGAGGRTAIGASYFYEDEVFHVGKNGDIEFGMVTENWEMYDSSDDEDENESGRVPQGHVGVTWHPRGKEEVVAETKVKLSDRSLMPGDVVRRLIAGKDTQRGYCRNIRVSAAVQIHGTKKIITNVLASNLKSVQKMQSDVAVYLDSWIGLVRDMRYKITLRFADSSTCVVDSYAIGEHFEDTRPSADGFGGGETFFPGQKLRGQMRHLKDADWSFCSDDLKRAKDRKMVSAIVTNVQADAMSVQWQWQTPESPLQKEKKEKEEKSAGDVRANPFEKHPPPSLISGDDLTRVTCLNLFDSCTVQLGDISFYNPTGKDTIVDRGAWKKMMAAGIHGPQEPKKASETSLKTVASGEVDTDDNALGDTAPVSGTESDNKIETVKTNSSGQLSQHGHKKSLPRVSTRALRKKKLKKSRQQPKLLLVPETPVVVETVHTSSSVDVVWQDGTIEENMRSIELYPIHHLDDHEFFPGDFVIRAESTDFRVYGVIQNMDHSGRVALVKWFEAYSFLGEQRPTELQEEEMSVYDIKDHPDFRFRPGTIVIRVANMLPNQHSAGQILDNYPDGQVRVWWTNDVTSSCWPQDLFRLGDYDSDEGEIWDDNGNGSDNDCDDGPESDSSWETEVEEELVESDSLNRYNSIGKLIEQIQSSLVGTRETIIATAPVSVSDDGQAVSNTNLSDTLDRRGITKKLLLIFKDCQYLDKMMGSKFFDEKFLKDWFKQMESTCKSGQMLEQVKRFFEVSGLEKSGSSFSIKDGLKVEESEPTAEPSTEATPSTSSVKTPGEESEALKLAAEASSQNVIVSELCSVILNKLVAAHSEYENRFGSMLSDTSLGGEKNEVKSLPSITEELSPVEGEPSKGEVELSLDFSLGKEKESCEILLPPAPPSTPASTSLSLNCSPESTATATAAAVKDEKSSLEKKASYFTLVESVPDTHRYRLTSLQPQNQRQFIKTVRAEVTKLRDNLPEGIFFKGYEDRMDLYSVMISGPENTPYEDGIFFFDIQLPPAYPDAPPLVHYVSFCPDRLNPNLYECGKVCVSLLGTWSGKGTEVWTSESSLLQLLVSIQGLILVPEPYYNEAGYEKQRGSQQGLENSRMYNEMVLIKLVQSMSRMLANPHSPWEEEITRHIQLHGPRMIQRYRHWLQISEKSSAGAAIEDDEIGQPGFPLLPVSKGFSITLKKTLDNFAKQCAPSTPTLSGPVGFGLTSPSSSNLKSA